MARAKREFDEGSKLGFMRFIQVYNVFVLLMCAAGMVFVRGSSVVLDTAIITNLIILLAQAAVIWLIANRKLYTRQIVIGIELFEFAVVTVADFVNGAFSFGAMVFAAVPYALIICYFAFSRRAKAVLVQPWSDHSLRSQQEEKSRKMWDPKSPEFWMRLLIYFFAFSVIGHWMEQGVQVLVVNGTIPGTIAAPDSLTWRDDFNPFFIYGIAVAFCGLILYPAFLWLQRKLPHIWQAAIVSFIFNTVFCVVAELILGLLFNADYSAWDYRDQFMNFMGQICLLYTLAFGVMSSIITWFVYPLMERCFSYVNRDVFRIIFVVSCVLFLFIYATYNVDLDTLMPGSDLAIDASEASQRS